MNVNAGSLQDLRNSGQLRVKVGSAPVVVFWHEDEAWAIEDRCPHLGFPLHRGTVEAGMVTCHWHHARFDLASGCTLDLFADDARGFDVSIAGDTVFVSPRTETDTVDHLRARLRNGLEDDLSLVIAKSVLGLLDAGVPPEEIVLLGLDFGVAYRSAGWGAGLTVLVAMANVLPHLREDDRALALIHGLAFVSRDTRGRPPRFPLDPLDSADVPSDRLGSWYRRFIDTRSDEAAERTLATALQSAAIDEVEAMMFAAVTDHVFIDEGHTLDFTNKAFEALDHVGHDEAHRILPTMVLQTAQASRHEELASWRHPDDLAGLVLETNEHLPNELIAPGTTFEDVGALGWSLLEEDPETVVRALLDALGAGASPEQVARAVSYAAALRITRFHTQNDFGDWNTVHHSFTTANALHQAIVRNPTPELLRGVVHNALRVFLDRFLNVPPARLPETSTGDLIDLDACWDVQGMVDRAGAIAYGFLASGGDRSELIAALGRALLAEDAQFHWHQVFEAGVRQAGAWPEGSEESTLILVGMTRFLAAHTPTRRELPKIVEIARRLRRGEALYDDAELTSGTLTAADS
jgi:nitrite reductase/ring-hydroxylating ferredoxin subunit